MNITDSPAENELRSLRLSVGLYALIFALKLGVYFVTGVMGLLAEALHTLSDIFVSGFLLVATIWSRKEADEVHMFGYGRAQNVAVLVAATLFISFTSFKLYEEAIPRLFQPEEAAYRNVPLALGVILGSMLIAAFPLVRLLTQKKRGAAAKAPLMELINDEFGLWLPSSAPCSSFGASLWVIPSPQSLWPLSSLSMRSACSGKICVSSWDALQGRSSWAKLSAWHVQFPEYAACTTCGQSTSRPTRYTPECT